MEIGAIPTPAEVAELSGAELDEALVKLEVARRQVEAAHIAVLDRADESGRFRHDGHASVRGWVVALTNSSPVETRRRLQTMRALRELPDTAAGLANGTIGVEQVREIAKLHANPRLRELVVDGDRKLVEHSRKDFVSFSEVLHRWSQFGDPRGADASPGQLATRCCSTGDDVSGPAAAGRRHATRSTTPTSTLEVA